MTVASGNRASSPRPQRLLELTHHPDGSSWTDRENLVDVLERDLLGPAHGDEELLEAQPDALYLVGRIAPAKLLDTDEPVTQADAEDADEEIVPSDDARLGRGVPLGTVDQDTAGNEDEGAEDVPLRRGLMIPASMGMRFQVHRAQESVTVHASWGTYRPESPDPSDDGAVGARPRRLYRRTPHHHTRVLPVATYQPGQTETVVLEDRVVLRVDVMDQGDTRIVELALCNDRETPRKIPVDAWLYQTQLHVEADGADAFLPVR
ncbi:MAG TPA: helicase, partial [Brevibacterium sp.]|nr:helicase [Brevibacterium sp.]